LADKTNENRLANSEMLIRLALRAAVKI
jgi:hypothetical protein